MKMISPLVLGLFNKPLTYHEMIKDIDETYHQYKP